VMAPSEYGTPERDGNFDVAAYLTPLLLC
jgi:hypothetical protein